MSKISANFIGQVLDDKYKIDRELGHGGMGTVYLATHLGTERPVAVKIIAPQFMARPEFVERFRREARAAGRLRHPNVVNVTDFGFAQTEQGTVAYLVMEYLDGCTLGEILEEENNLPVGWTLDIIDQVCSAVHEAHQQGIIHRDLKPDNIWLEPNLRGGYSVKVLDFGIAKLEENVSSDSSPNSSAEASHPTKIGSARGTVADLALDATIHDSISPTMVPERSSGQATKVLPSAASEAGTMIQPAADGNEAGTAIFPAATLVPETIFSSTGSAEVKPVVTPGGSASLLTPSRSSDLTRVGAVLGTPLYMSPEQCRGDKLDARSDVYSIGVIAYQMLSGSTPFSGEFTEVMRAHKELPVPPLEAKKVRTKLKRVILSALEKDPDKRPQTAEAFSSILRSRSEGIFGLLRRAGMIYSEHIGKFAGLALLLYVPFIIATIANVSISIYYINDTGESPFAIVRQVGMTIVTMFTAFFCGYLIVGTTTWIMNQILSFPLRPVRIRPALIATRRNWRHLIGTGLISTIITLIGYVLCVVPGLILSVLLALVAPVVMMENLRGISAMRRSKLLVMRSLRTTMAAIAILFFVPGAIAVSTQFIVAVTVKAFAGTGEKLSNEINDEKREEEKEDNIRFSIGSGEGVTIADSRRRNDMSRQIRGVIRESLSSLIMLPIQILLTSLSSIIVALLYFKTRQAGGESLEDLFGRFEETGKPRKKWQERVRQRLIQSGRVTGRT